MRQLGRGEGDHGIGAVCAFDGKLTRVRIPTGRQIHGHYRRSGITIQKLAAGNGEAMQGRPEAGAQDGIDEQLCALQTFAEFRILEAGMLSNRQRRNGQAIEHRLSIAMNITRIAQNQHGELTTSLRQPARSHKAIAPVVAPAAKDGDPPALGQLAQDKTRDGPAGMLHQLQRWNSKAFTRDPIDGSHLIRSQNLHTQTSFHARGARCHHRAAKASTFLLRSKRIRMRVIRWTQKGLRQETFLQRFQSLFLIIDLLI